MKVLILGYYDRHNVGDDMFKFIFRQYFNDHWPNCDLMIKNTDDLEEVPEDVNLIICGGGDLINDYFLRKIHRLIEPVKHQIPIYAIGVGFPYQGMLDHGALDCFDFVAHRNQIDQPKLLNLYGPNRVQYFPDLGFLLPTWSAKGISTPAYREMAAIGWKNGVIKTNAQKDKCGVKKIGVFLSKTIYHPNNPQAYQQIIDSLAYFLIKLAEKRKNKKVFSCCRKGDPEYEIFLISCCTNDSEKEDDRKINHDLYQRIRKYGDYENIHVINQKMEMEEVIPIFKQFYLTICTRFHAHIFSLLAKVPIMSVYSSRKVQNLLETHDLVKYGIKMEVDPDKLFPIKLNTWPLFEKYQLICREYETYLSKLTLIKEVNKIGIKKLVSVINNLIWTPLKYLGPETETFQIMVQNKTKEVAQKIVKYLLPGISRAVADNYVKRIVLGDEDRIKVIDLVNISQFENKDQVAEYLTQMMVFTLVGTRLTDFNWGLERQILEPEYNLYDSVKWILTAFNQSLSYERIINNPTMIKYRKFDMLYLRQHDLEGFHRSGWSYVVRNLELFHHPQGSVFDSFLDKTFGWNYDFYQSVGVLPFKKSWVGVFHHSYHVKHSQNNLVEVFKKPLFLTSLATCRGIYVLSNYLRDWLLERLSEVGFPNIKVEVLIHPTEFVDVQFDFDRFLENSEKKVIQIGAWYRNSYAIYQLAELKHLKKCALKGKDMENYYLNQDKLDEIKEQLYQLGHQWASDGGEDNNIGAGACICRPCEVDSNEIEHRCNKYLAGIIKMIEKNHSEVEVIDRVTNQEYDQLLSQNVVLINLVDASAVNTVIECIVRKTPIIINRLPSIEEYLGSDYPLYYDDLYQAQDILNDLNKLKEGHEYLKKMDCTRFHINTFLGDLINSEIYQSI